MPVVSRGAAKAIEDGAVLAARLARIGGSEISRAFRLYESLRLPRTSRVQAASKETKPVSISPMAHSSAREMLPTTGSLRQLRGSTGMTHRSARRRLTSQNEALDQL